MSAIPLLPGLGAAVFVSSPLIPPGVCVATKNDQIMWFGALRNLPLDTLPGQSRIHINTRDYNSIADKVEAQNPNAPEVIVFPD